ncbi:MAG: hypothetical protein J7K54_01765 [Candidatus Aenigmarchaeota archaeon]|nr:hypothetical protein [Candidatus Aenigmarchaeota archaeon]
MLSDNDLRVLDIINKRLLAKHKEIREAVGEADGITESLQRLMSSDCIKSVEPMGERCFVITQKGTRILRDAKNPEKRVQSQSQQGFMTS